MVSTAIKEEKILINGLDVNVKIKGEGSPFLILHGWGGSSDSWIKVIDILAMNGYRVICPDFPGFGKSQTPLHSWGIDEYVEWTIALIDKLELKEFVLLGHSFGGRISIRLGSDYSQRLNDIILCASAGIKPDKGIKNTIIYSIAKIGNVFFGFKVLKGFKEAGRRVFYKLLRGRDYAKVNGVMKETIKKVLERDLLPDLDKINNRTLLIWGEKDKMVPLKYARIFKEKIKNSKLEVLPGVGHSPHLKSPDKLTEIILKFLK